MSVRSAARRPNALVERTGGYWGVHTNVAALPVSSV